MTMPFRGPPKIFIVGCVIALFANFLAGALAHLWIFYLGLVFALPMIAFGIRNIFRGMDNR